MSNYTLSEFWGSGQKGEADIYTDVEILKSYPEIKERFPELNTIDDNSGMVFLKAKTRNIGV